MPEARDISPFERLVRAVRSERLALRAHPADLASIVGNRMAADGLSWQMVEGMLRVAKGTRPLLRWRRAIEEVRSPATFISGLDVSACAVLPTRFVGGTVDGAMYAWDVSMLTDTPRWSFGEPAHPAPVSCIEVVGGNELVVSGDVDGNCYMWSPSGSPQLGSFEGHRTAITSIAFHTGRQLLAAGAADGSVRVWERGATVPASALVGHRAPIAAVAFCPDAEHLVSASADGTLRSWETLSGRCLGTMHGHTAEVIGCAFLPRNPTESGDPRIVSASRDGLVKLWTREGDPVGTLGGHGGPITDLRLWPPHLFPPAVAVTAGEDATVRIWNLTSEREERILRGHAAPVLQAAPCGSNFEMLLSVDANGGCRLWKWDTGALLNEFGINSGRRAQLSVSSRGLAAACTTEDGTLARIDLTTVSDASLSACVALDSDGGRLVIGLGSGVRLVDWEIEQHPFDKRLTESGTPSITDALWDGYSFLTVRADGTLTAWEDDGTPLHPLALPKQTTTVAVNGDGTMLVTVAADGAATAFDRTAESMTTLSTLPPHRAKVTACACAMNRRALLGGEDGGLRLWDCPTGVVTLDVQAHASAVTDCDISHDGSLLLSASADGTLRVWNANGTMRQHIPAHTAAITACWMGAETNRALTCSRDATVKLWDLDSGRCLETFYGEAPCVSMAVAANRPVAAIADSRGCITILQILDGFGLERRDAAQ